MNGAELAGRSVLVTGGSRGIGLAVCEELASRGARVAIVARDAEAVEAAVAALDGSGHFGRAMDVADADAWPALIAEAGEDGVLHGLVTAAAVLEPIGPTASVDPNAVLAALRTNLWGTFLAIHHSLPALVAAGDGAFVSFSGGGATGPLPRYDAYAASKAAVVRLTENVAVDEPRVRSNSIAPGFVATGIHEATLAAGESGAGAQAARTADELAAGGVPAERAARLVAILLGPEAEGISGKLISAAWDPWEEQAFLARLRDEPNLCVLRRIDDVHFAERHKPE